ncbi:uncharacterized protein dtx3lb.3 [Danio aesculapii]|uniref:uncharacterized protein dtx3lb.3 n=1 Tax=Danio aesculapii TaxID=1142201 RepID=UPI0024C028B5|nr:uncharacterized protein dtx3lb.3 [Danio aesculapii]
MNQSQILLEENLSMADNEEPKPTAPLDIGKLMIKVDWTEAFPDRWRARLQIALQTWLSKLEENATVHSIKLMNDPSFAEVQITSSTALEALKKLKFIPLRFKNENKEVTAWICQDGADHVNIPQKSLQEENKTPSPEVITSIPQTSAASNEESAASNIALNETNNIKTTETTPERSDGLIVPLYEFWYMHHAYRKELEQFEKQHGVSICAEVSVSIKHTQSSSPDSVSKTLEDFQKLVQGCVGGFSQAVISHDMDSDMVKETLRTVQSEEEKMMFTMTARDCLLFGPKKYTDMIKKETTKVERQFKDKLMKNVFDDKKTRQEKLIPDYGAGGGPDLDKRVNFRERIKTEAGFSEDSKGNSGHDSKDADAEEETCAICMDSFTDKQKLKCGHEFCRECLRMSVESLGSICPVCKEVFGKLEGNQPDGTMRVTMSRMSLPGYPRCDTIEILYNIPSGIQTKKHPNPGKPYHGTSRHAYLPDNDEGREVLALLQRAFDQKLIFTVGTSTTTGVQNAVTWKDIHHKTSPSGGPECYGYPDPVYLKRVKYELKAKGIESKKRTMQSPIQYKLQKELFDDKMKKTREINLMSDYGAGAAGGPEQNERVNFRGQIKTEAGFSEDSKGNSGHDSKDADAEEETCAICMDSFTDKQKLKCGHEFCRECLRMSVESLGSICAVCKEVFGKLEGNQPDGTMRVTMSRMSLPGYPRCGSIEIYYNIPSGTQTRAFDQKLIFTVGTSTTTGVQNAVTWKDIHHKTSPSGGPECYGYPDPVYLKRVKYELKAKGIESKKRTMQSPIQYKLQKELFDDKMKKTREINLMSDYGAGAAGGPDLDERVNFRGQIKTEAGFSEDSKGNSGHDSKDADAEEETCAICMDSFTDKQKLKCGHEFCRECLRMSVESLGSICAVCKEVFGKLEGNQPDGTMRVTTSWASLPGYPRCGSIEIYYDIPSGIQTKKHPNPGKPYHGTSRRAYLPDNNKGREVLALLQRAFDQKLIFTVGTSTTTGVQNAVTWKDIHHKTSPFGGPQSYGYPDADYLKRVKDELKAKGIEL